MALIDIGGIFYEASTVGSGTGNYNSFVRIQNNDDESGYNTDADGQLNNKDGPWTHALLISSLEVVNEGGTDYYEIRLDLNEIKSGDNPNITLEDLQIFFGPAAGAGAFPAFAGLTKVFDLGTPLLLVDTNSGSGTDDYRFLLPTALFTDKSGYLTLFADFSGSSDGFEEFRARSQDVGDGLPLINLEKVALPTNISEGTPTDILYTYTLTNLSPGDDALQLTSFIDDNGNGNGADDIDLLAGVTLLKPLGIHYVSGDDDNDQLLDKNETWTFQYLKEDVELDAPNVLTNVATVNAVDEEGNNTDDTDDAAVTADNLDPTIDIVKTASPTQIQAGSPTLVTFTYEITNTSPASTDPIMITSLIDDFGTPADPSDDKDLLVVGTFVGGDGNGNSLLDKGETWTYTYSTTLTLDPGQVRTNIVTVEGEDDEGNTTSGTDDAVVTAFNLGRTPGFWSNNGSRLWDGDVTTTRNNGLGIVPNGEDLMYKIKDTDGDGDVDNAAGVNGFLMIGDWSGDGIAQDNENVLIISRSDALSLLNSSEKQQQDGRFMLARDVIASWLNYLGGSFVGDPDNADGDSVVHYIDQAVAWLIEATTNEDHIFTRAELTAGTKVGTSTAPWQIGYNFNATAGVQHDVPPAGEHDLGDDVNLDILGGGILHSGLDHYNNHGFI